MVGLALLLSACVVVQDPASGPVRVFKARPLVPEGWYEDIYRQMAKCTGKSLPYSGLEFYVTEPNAMVNENGQVAAGVWSAPNRVYFDARFLMNGYVVRHEFAHHLLQMGDPAHDDPLFQMCVGI